MRFRFEPATFGAVIVLASGLALAGCSAEVNVGTGSSVSGEKLADDVRGDYEDRTGVAMTTLTCEGVDGEVGAKFNCTGRNARSVQLEITGKVTDTDADGFDYNWKVAKGIAPGVLYERALRRQIEAQGVALSEVRCPVEVEIEVGSNVYCEATDVNGVNKDVKLRLTDLNGGFDYVVQGTGPGGGSPPASSQ